MSVIIIIVIIQTLLICFHYTIYHLWTHSSFLKSCAQTGLNVRYGTLDSRWVITTTIFCHLSYLLWLNKDTVSKICASSFRTMEFNLSKSQICCYFVLSPQLSWTNPHLLIEIAFSMYEHLLCYKITSKRPLLSDGDGKCTCDST